MVTGVAAAVLAGYGAFLIFTSLVCGWQGLRPGPPTSDRSPRPTVRQRLDGVGLRDVRLGELAAAVTMLAIVGAAAAFALFGGVVPAMVAGVFAASFPLAGFRSRQRRKVAAAQDAWPRLLEELRLRTGSVGRSIPQALFEVGRRAPEELRPAFAVAEREWLLTMDFERTTDVLKQQLADPTADIVCETLVVAHEVGGGGLDRRLAELVEDRVLDSQGRKDATSKQAGVRFARRFVLLVPLGMAVAGLSIGSGRAAYETASGQIAVVIGLAAVVACWVWSGRLMRVPGEPRVFGRAISVTVRKEDDPAPDVESQRVVGGSGGADAPPPVSAEPVKPSSGGSRPWLIRNIAVSVTGPAMFLSLLARPAPCCSSRMSTGQPISAEDTPDRRTQRRLERSNDVYLAAVQLFIDQGYDATTMDDIAVRADVARASVFNYFPRKTLFLEEWASRRRHQAVDAVRLEHLEDDSIGDILARYFDELARVNTATRPETVSLMNAAVTTTNILSEPALGHELAIYIARAKGRGELRPEVDPDQAGLLLATGYFATVTRWIAVDPAPFDLQTELHGLLAIVLGGLLAA